jgi:hypothetical protein
MFYFLLDQIDDMQFQINGKKNLLAQSENKVKKLQEELKITLQEMKILQQELKKSKDQVKGQGSDPNLENSIPKQSSSSPKKSHLSNRWNYLKETFGNNLNTDELKIKTELELIGDNKNFDLMPVEQLVNLQRTCVRKIIILI